MIHNIVLLAVFLVVTFTILFVNADPTGILHVQVKGADWFGKEDTQREMQGHGAKNQFTCVVGTRRNNYSRSKQRGRSGK